MTECVLSSLDYTGPGGIVCWSSSGHNEYIIVGGGEQVWNTIWMSALLMGMRIQDLHAIPLLQFQSLSQDLLKSRNVLFYVGPQTNMCSLCNREVCKLEVRLHWLHVLIFFRAQFFDTILWGMYRALLGLFSFLPFLSPTFCIALPSASFLLCNTIALG